MTTQAATIGERRPHLAAAADGALVTAAAFSVAVGVQALLTRLGVADAAGTSFALGAAAVVGALLVVLGNTLTLLGPAVAWMMRGHKMSGRALGSIAAGIVGGLLGVGVLAVLAPLVGRAFQLFASNELLGLIVMLAIGGVLFVGAAVFALVDAAEDLRRSEAARRPLDVVRIVAVALAVLFAAGVVIVVRLGAPPDVSEAFAFGLAAAVFGAIAISVTDAVDSWLSRRAHARQPISSAP